MVQALQYTDALLRAIRRQDLDAVREALAGGALLDVFIGHNGIVHELVRQRQSDFVCTVLGLFDDYVHEHNIQMDWDLRDEQNLSPWFYATIREDALVIQKLVQMGVNIHQTDGTGKNAWHFAISAGASEVFEFLKTTDVALDQLDRLGYGCLEYAIVFHQVDMAQWLMQQPSVVQSIQECARMQVLTVPMDGHVYEEYGNVWHVLAANVQFSAWHCCAMWLQQLGVDVNSKDARGNTPLHVCVIHNHLELARWLLDQGANAHVQNHFEQYPEQMMSQNSALDSWYEPISAAMLIRAFKEQHTLEQLLPLKKDGEGKASAKVL